MNFTRTFPKEHLTTSWHLFYGVEMLLEVTGICGAARRPRMTAARKAAAKPGGDASTTEYFERKGDGRRSEEASTGDRIAEGGKSSTGALHWPRCYRQPGA